MHYKILAQSHARQLFRIELSIAVPVTQGDDFQLHLLRWRPGRYELQNYAANILYFEVTDKNGHEVAYQKRSPSCWEIQGSGELTIAYGYYAKQLDGGGCWLDSKQWYLNPINWALEPLVATGPITIELAMPAESYVLACSLPKNENGWLVAQDFDQLVDSPIMASDTLHHESYQLQGHTFHIWIQGEVFFDWARLLADFRKFTQAQIAAFGGFPAPEYHFLVQMPPFPLYHGVEHADSTVLCFGPAEKLTDAQAYTDFLGLASHELYHAWNIKRIRPAEMLPYNFKHEQFFQTGFVAEGFTTYYGDLMLVRAGVIDKQTYFAELNKLLMRHLLNEGRFYRSLAEASTDLWADGYKKSAQPRTVSIYIKGALLALMLDLTIIRETHGRHHLDDLMRELWSQFGLQKQGYTWLDCRRMAEKLTNTDLSNFFEQYLFGTQPIEQELRELLASVGCELVEKPEENPVARHWGFRLETGTYPYSIAHISQNSPQAALLCIGDELLAVNGKKLKDNQAQLLRAAEAAELTLFRAYRLEKIQIKAGGQEYYTSHRIVTSEKLNAQQQINLQSWLA